MKTLIVLSGALLLTMSIARAQETERGPRPPSVTAHGEAVITVEPDQAEIDIGVVTQAKNAPDAARENSDKLSRVMTEVKKLLGKGDEVKTASYSLNPNYRYPQGGKPEIVGYTATNILRIKTGALANVGKLIDASMQSGANTIQRLVFNLKDEHAAQLQALRLASTKAKAKAEEIAAAPTPVEAGTIEVRSSVTLTGELGTKQPSRKTALASRMKCSPSWKRRPSVYRVEGLE